MRRGAISMAAVGFFGLAMVSAASGLPPHVCAIRGAAGAAAAFLATLVVGRIVAWLVISALWERVNQLGTNKDKSREHAE